MSGRPNFSVTRWIRLEFHMSKLNKTLKLTRRNHLIFWHRFNSNATSCLRKMYKFWRLLSAWKLLMRLSSRYMKIGGKNSNRKLLNRTSNSSAVWLFPYSKSYPSVLSWSMVSYPPLTKTYQNRRSVSTLTPQSFTTSTTSSGTRWSPQLIDCKP